MARKRNAPVTDMLRQAILECGFSFKRLEKETGVTRQSLMGFAKGERTIHLAAADRVAAFLGLELKQKGR